MQFKYVSNMLVVYTLNIPGTAFVDNKINVSGCWTEKLIILKNKEKMCNRDKEESVFFKAERKN